MASRYYPYSRSAHWMPADTLSKNIMATGCLWCWLRALTQTENCSLSYIECLLLQSNHSWRRVSEIHELPTIHLPHKKQNSIVFVVLVRCVALRLAYGAYQWSQTCRGFACFCVLVSGCLSLLVACSVLCCSRGVGGYDCKVFVFAVCALRCSFACLSFVVSGF